MATDPIIVADSIHRSFLIGTQRLEVLRGINLKIWPGQRVFLCGASGAGKTTLLYILAGLEKPDQGRLSIAGQAIYKLSSRQLAKIRNTQLGYVFQSYQLLPELTALENVALPALIGGREAKKEAAEWLERVGLTHRHNHLPYELSGGEQQRVAMARALINDPPLILADEPTGNLDSRTGEEVMSQLLSLVAETRKTLIVVTHDAKLAERGDRTITLADGLVIGDVDHPIAQDQLSS
jgi:putative ABC transport system ATP-binding protein/lipoprotein-releasing system ATP-binding protein